MIDVEARITPRSVRAGTSLGRRCDAAKMNELAPMATGTERNFETPCKRNPLHKNVQFAP